MVCVPLQFVLNVTVIILLVHSIDELSSYIVEGMIMFEECVRVRDGMSTLNYDDWSCYHMIEP